MADAPPSSPLRVPGGPDQEIFEAQVAAHRHELQVHCYRMLGSWTDAEDVVQEVLLRAWRGLPGFEGRSSLRTWLYQIATNACLSALSARKRRALPELLRPPAQEGAPLEPPAEEVAWLQPMPTPGALDVEEHAASRQAVGLAFTVALQQLPARQRATLLLRDVAEWEAAEVAALLGISTAAVNSALVRARDRMERFRAAHGDEPPIAPLDAGQKRTVAAYLDAWEAADIGSLAALLSEEAVFSMPPYPTWYRGRAAIARALAEVVFAHARAFRLLPTVASGRPAFVLYRRGIPGPGLRGARATTDVFTGTGVQVLVPAADRLAKVITFLDRRLVPAFGAPPELAAPG